MLKKESSSKGHFYRFSKRPMISDKDLQLKLKVSDFDTYMLKRLYKCHIDKIKT